MKRANLKKTMALILTLALAAPAAAYAETEEAPSEETTQIANPWTDMTKEELEKVSGVTFGVPEDAKDVVYRWLEEDMETQTEQAIDETIWTIIEKALGKKNV